MNQESRRDIVRRRLDFTFDPAAVPRHWYRRDAHLTAFWNAMSLLFPEGERFFVESVRRYRDRIHDPELKGQIDDFIAQEAMHGRGHRSFNEMLREAGLGEVSSKAEEQLKRLLDFARRTLSRRSQLAVTCALEHYTAILAEQLLTDADHRGSGDDSVQGLWTWHALEESEHKAVAFDVYRALRGGYARRVAIMLLVSAFFWAELGNVHVRFLAVEGEAGNVRGWARGIGYLWGKPGILRKLVPAYLDYFRPGFHPDDRDTSALLEEWRERLFGAEGELRQKWKEPRAAA